MVKGAVEASRTKKISRKRKHLLHSEILASRAIRSLTDIQVVVDVFKRMELLTFQH